MRQPKERRRQTKLDATIHSEDGRPLTACAVLEISESTALLSVPDGEAVPITFILTFARGTRVQRRCTVLSREDDRITVLMLKGSDDERH
jgi:hypothetical protein